MQQIDSLVNMIGQPVQQVPIIGFVGNLFLAMLMSYILAYVYVARGQALSNRRSLSANFMLISLTTMFIISVVKSSLALSLGLVGALSIIRFRTAIKEPEELAYLFLTIAIGLGLGADQTVVTIVAFVFIVGAILVRSTFRENSGESHIYLQVQGNNTENTALDKILKIVKKYCESADLKRHDESTERFESIFIADFKNSSSLMECSKRLRMMDKTVDVKIIDSRT